MGASGIPANQHGACRFEVHPARARPIERGGQSRENMGPLNRPDKSYEYTQRFPDDKEAMEGQGEIAVHGLEHLASSDRGVIQFRNILRRAIAAVRAGEDPKGILRDPAKAESVPTTAGSIVRLPVAATA